MRSTKEELEKAVTDWIGTNPKAFDALKDAVRLISDKDKPTSYKFLMELLRYNMVLGNDTLHELVDLFSYIGFSKGEYAIPNEVTAGVSRRLDAMFQGYEGYSAHLRHSKLDDEEEVGQLALF